MNTEEIIKRIARENNVTSEEVKEEMRYAIRDAMQSKDPKAQMLWKQIAPDGKEPSLDHFLRICADMINKRME